MTIGKMQPGRDISFRTDIKTKCYLAGDLYIIEALVGLVVGAEYQNILAIESSQKLLKIQAMIPTGKSRTVNGLLI